MLIENLKTINTTITKNKGLANQTVMSVTISTTKIPPDLHEKLNKVLKIWKDLYVTLCKNARYTFITYPGPNAEIKTHAMTRGNGQIKQKEF